MTKKYVLCPICGKDVNIDLINTHLDRGCDSHEKKYSLSLGSIQQKLFNENFLNKSFPCNKNHRYSENILSCPSLSKRGVQNENELSSKEASYLKKSKNNSNFEFYSPLSERVRPQTLDDFVGQEDLIGKYGLLRKLIENDKFPSFILWGASGVGKTTLARIISKTTNNQFKEFSATSSTICDVKRAFDDAKKMLSLTGRKTIIFIDEIQQFNKMQQNVFLHYIEEGIVILIGATTENPSFKINNALLSRCRVFVLHKLSSMHVFEILKNAISIIKSSSENIINIDDSVIEYLANLSDGDARIALNTLEIILNFETKENDIITKESVRNILKRTSFVYDRVGDSHYDTISAFHKSIRGSDANAALYYLGRMLLGGEDPLYIARRMIRIASEDIGTSDNNALILAISAYQAVQSVGMPEADIFLAHAAIYLAEAKKSNRIYLALNNVKHVLKTEDGAFSAEIPLHIRNCPTKLMSELGYGVGYKYNHLYKDGKVKQEYLPSTLKTRIFLDVDKEMILDPEFIE
ncbi:hypothetical protein PNEG_03590 [Pneumocystis murina B123]|uniref:UBZ4-type domain-containing protein n=1 Tax=Pneumocystis murina (strain B123) TaxID=1069680 RepID=M7NHW1_PNEMU|nr:hypothetical protein PNEG_03590 [Pneumocystis murina B123]EMR08153.1 hypothetical protein PNEG_03590 [Pneumocystis murina B123]